MPDDVAAFEKKVASFLTETPVYHLGSLYLAGKACTAQTHQQPYQHAIFVNEAHKELTATGAVSFCCKHEEPCLITTAVKVNCS